jgi:ATP/maltotriose-dependent transcriptional regulator MalT
VAGDDDDAVTTADLAEARHRFAVRAWGAAYDGLRAADASQPLGPADREALALAAFLTGHESEAETAREQAHDDFLAVGDPEGAARVAFWLALALVLRGEEARGAGWFGRAKRVLDEGGRPDSVWHGYLLVPRAMALLFGGRASEALPVHEAALAVAAQHADADLRLLALHGHGQALIALGDVEAGLAELDEVLSGLAADRVSPQVVGLLYCAAIETCRDRFDLRRGREWTEALSRWCAEQPDLVPYRGQCLVHRAEILQVHGSWPDAAAEAQRACDRLHQPVGQVAEGMALYQRGELHRLRGELDAAADAYREASRYGHDPIPGFALLRLAQGEIDGAGRAAKRMLDEYGIGPARSRLLAAAVEVRLATGDNTAGRRLADELASVAEETGTEMLAASAAYARGTVLLASGDATMAISALRAACKAWRDLQAPYEVARARFQLGLAYRAAGDRDAADLELDGARGTFTSLGAAVDLARVESVAPAKPGVITERECEVLRLVAAGRTNREIAAELVISEHTVSRHLQNMFMKLGVTSRAAATAYGYEHHLV